MASHPAEIFDPANGKDSYTDSGMADDAQSTTFSTDSGLVGRMPNKSIGIPPEQTVFSKEDLLKAIENRKKVGDSQSAKYYQELLDERNKRIKEASRTYQLTKIAESETSQWGTDIGPDGQKNIGEHGTEDPSVDQPNAFSNRKDEQNKIEDKMRKKLKTLAADDTQDFRVDKNPSQWGNPNDDSLNNPSTMTTRQQQTNMVRDKTLKKIKKEKRAHDKNALAAELTSLESKFIASEEELLENEARIKEIRTLLQS